MFRLEYIIGHQTLLIVALTGLKLEYSFACLRGAALSLMPFIMQFEFYSVVCFGHEFWYLLHCVARLHNLYKQNKIILILYTCQLFLRYKREIFILGVLGVLQTTRSFPKIPEEVQSIPKKSEVFRRRPKSAEGEVIEKTLIHKIRDREKGIVIYSLTRGFRSLHGSEVTYFWKLCQARRQQLTFFNQA